MFVFSSVCRADDFGDYGEFDETQVYQDRDGNYVTRTSPRPRFYDDRERFRSGRHYREQQLQDEIYETEIVRQQARRENIRNTLNTQQYNRGMQGAYQRRYELETDRIAQYNDYNRRSNDIGIINQGISTIGNAARQANQIQRMFSGKYP